MVNQNFDKFIEEQDKHQSKYLGGANKNKGITHEKTNRGNSPGSEGRDFPLRDE